MHTMSTLAMACVTGVLVSGATSAQASEAACGLHASCIRVHSDWVCKSNLHPGIATCCEPTNARQDRGKFLLQAGQ